MEPSNKKAIDETAIIALLGNVTIARSARTILNITHRDTIVNRIKLSSIRFFHMTINSRNGCKRSYIKKIHIFCFYHTNFFVT